MRGAADREPALELLQAFASVGVQAFAVTLTNLKGQKLPQGYYSPRSLDQWRHRLGPMLQAARVHQHNVIVRPGKSAGVELIQLDDLAESALARLDPVSLVVLRTSPGNGQSWVAVPEATPDFARRLRQGSGADASASGATRLPGSQNFKVQYAPHFPTIEILACHPGLVVPRATLESWELVAPLTAVPYAAAGVSGIPAQGRKWPSYQRCVSHAPPVRGGEARPDISKADFVWCMTALDWGWSLAATAARLMQESRKAQENGEHYALLTVRNAAAAVARRRGHPEVLARFPTARF
jgi:RepB DNA-primase from phage plasmid